MSELFLGIDGGGTRTRAVVLDGHGDEQARLEGGPTLVDPAAPSESIGTVIALARQAAQMAGDGTTFRGFWAGLAGAGSEPIRTVVEDALVQERLATEVHVGTDAEAAFFDAFGDGPGILVVAGTGSAVLGRGQSSEFGLVGGWGMQLGDEGSGYALGMAGLRSVARAEDGRGQTTALTEGVLAELGLGAPRELIAWVATADKRDVAALAPLVCATAEGGDETANALVESAIEDLIGQVLTAIRVLGPWNGRPMVAMVGGLLGEDRPLRSRLQASLSGMLCTPVARPVDAARGAASLAMRMTDPSD